MRRWTLDLENFQIGMQSIADVWIEFHHCTAVMQIDKIVSRADMGADSVGGALGNRSVGAAWTGAGQVEFVLGGALAASVGSLVDDRDANQATTQWKWINRSDEAAYGGHRFEFVAVDATEDQKIRSISGAGDDSDLEFYGVIHGANSKA